jgi:hypothetical protein
VEVVSGTSIAEIFSANDNWGEFVKKYARRIRNSVFTNVRKILQCKVSLGYAVFQCDGCGQEKHVPFTCKSRFCSRCGKIQTDNWIAKYETSFLDIPYQHIVFTIPSLLWPIIQANRKIGLNILVQVAMQTILVHTKNKLGYTPAIMAVIHTFGRDLKFNPHVHLLVSCGGLSKCKTKWIQNSYLHHLTLKETWRFEIITRLRKAALDGQIKLDLTLLDKAYSSAIQWYVHIGKKLSNAKKVVKYIGRYTKRPAIAQTRITSFINNVVTFWYEDHKEKRKINVSLPALDFIGKLVTHIHDHHFKQIRYAGLLAPRSRTSYLERARVLLGQGDPQMWLKISWRNSIKTFTGHDPLACPRCNLEMHRTQIHWPSRGDPHVFKKAS